MNEWKLVYEDRNARQELLREALCTLGNGYFATRGAAEEADAGEAHYPGTYLAGGYDRLESRVQGRTIENEDLVNWPNWLSLSFRPAGGEWLELDRVQIRSYRQELDLRRGVLERRIHFRDGSGRETSLVSRRLVHMGNPHLAALEWTLVPENWSGRIEIRSSLDGTVRNQGVDRYRDLAGEHLEHLESGRAGEEAVFLLVRTIQSRIRMAQTARTRVFLDDRPAPARRTTTQSDRFVGERLDVECGRGQALRVEKMVLVYTSRDRAISEESAAGREAMRETGGFEELLESHARAWERLWHRCDIEVDGNREAQLTLRLHIFHLLQTVSPNTIDLDVGLPARGLHGEAYRGHVFWDDMYVFPFLNLSLPELTRSMLMYRHRRLPAARRAARIGGNGGAMFPWQSGSDGREESQEVHLNPRSGRWIPDDTRLQRHVNAGIVYNVWQYYQSTEDREFLSFYGAELVLEIARFLASIARLNPERNRYEIRGVVGPDEYHTRYPDALEPGLDNNAYTNVMTAWVMRRAIQVLDLLAGNRGSELLGELGIEDEEVTSWREISRRMFVPFHDGGIISQFERYGTLEELDWEGYRRKYGDIQRLDRLLEAEGDTPNRYKAAKQADVLMLFYLFSCEELVEIFEGLGYEFTPDMIPKNIDYYMARTSHGSTLSGVVHAWVLARSNRAGSWRLFEKALRSDISDVQGGTTQEGIHLGAMAGTTDLFQRCYVGIEARDDVLWLNPRLPDVLTEVRLRVRYRGHWVSLRVNRTTLTVSLDKGWDRTMQVGFLRDVHTLREGDVKVFRLDAPPPHREGACP